MNKNFALIGAAGYIAPRHMKAIKDTKNNLLAAMDPSDSVGILDSYFPQSYFFTEFERFDRFIEKLKYDDGIKLNYVSICSPNYLHDAHMRFALRSGADAICEKPLVLNPWNIDKLQKVEENTGKKIYNILQLRVHPSIISLKEKIDKNKLNTKYEVDLIYITSRGNWYNTSWKGDENKSGGISTNIGVHFFDMLSWLFGDIQENKLFLKQFNSTSGFLEFERARVRWFLSSSSKYLPKSVLKKNQTTYRSITIDGEELEFSGGFTDLHTLVYKDIINGKGYGLDDARPSIEIVHNIRKSKIESGGDNEIPYLRKIK
jgi:UDP-N-acetyl-2-amino-2-deoxyglucuronate dehydrogenase